MRAPRWTPLLLLGVSPAVLAAQGYLVRLDSRAQHVTYRGVALDSVLASAVTMDSTGRLVTAAGEVVSCTPGVAFCEVYRPGLERRSGIWVLGGEVAAWGFGVPGLSLHANGRVGLDLGAADSWPGTRPAAQLLEGYLQYERAWLTGRAGRQVAQGRLGYTGFDGGLVGARTGITGLAGEVYAGYGLANAVALPVTSAALRPLDDFQPRARQLVVGANGGWHFGRGDLRLEYQREVDRDTKNFVSERVAFSGALGPVAGLRLTGGADYDIARGQWGSADADLRYGAARWGAGAGVRRYRPYFDLWTIWGVFSPVAYSAVNGSLWIVPVRGVEVHGGGERYWYDDPGAETPLQTVEDRGWRWNVGLGVNPAPRWSAGTSYQREFGPGAASQGWDATVAWQAAERVGVGLAGGRQVRPLEFRYNESAMTWVGLQANVRATDRLRGALSATRYFEDRRRPDATAFDWGQTRLTASLTWLLGNGADRPTLPPPVRRPGQR